MARHSRRLPGEAAVTVRGTRGDHRLALVDKDLVEKELMKFVGEIANW